MSATAFLWLSICLTSSFESTLSSRHFSSWAALPSTFARIRINSLLCERLIASFTDLAKLRRLTMMLTLCCSTNEVDWFYKQFVDLLSREYAKVNTLFQICLQLSEQLIILVQLELFASKSHRLHEASYADSQTSLKYIFERFYWWSALCLRTAFRTFACQQPIQTSIWTIDIFKKSTLNTFCISTCVFLEPVNQMKIWK